jgi:hypothetical protein
VIDETSLEGWAPVVGRDVKLVDLVDLAFDYRGDVTVRLNDGRVLTGYVYNRDGDVDEPYLQMFDPHGVSHTLGYAEIGAIAFTGKDTAAGKSYEAWLRRKSEVQAERPSAPPA